MIATLQTKAKLLKLIREHRQACGLTQAAVAMSAKLTRLAYHRIERGERVMKPSEFNAICAALGLDEKEVWRKADQEPQEHS